MANQARGPARVSPYAPGNAIPFFACYLERVITGQPAAIQATPSSQAGGKCLQVKTRVKAGMPPKLPASE